MAEPDPQRAFVRPARPSSPSPQDRESEAVAESPPGGAPVSGRRRWVRRLLLILGPLAVALVAAYLYATGGRFVSTDNAYVQADIVMIAPEISGTITAIDVVENGRVTAGQPLFRIDPVPYRIALSRAEAEMDRVRAALAGLKASYRQKEEEIALARANLAFAQREFDRQAKLVATHAISRSRFDSARHEVDVARHNLSVTTQGLAEIRAQLGGDPDIAVDDYPQFLEARAARDRAARDLAHTTVRAPFAGVASNVPTLGDYVESGTAVMSVVADRGAWVDANFKETDLTYVRPGQPAEIRVDTYPGRVWKGVVKSISQATGAEFSIIPPQNATGNWVKVVQRITVRVAVEPEEDAPPLRAGMSTEVEIDTGHRRPLPGFVRTALAWIGGPPASGGAHAGERP